MAGRVYSAEEIVNTVREADVLLTMVPPPTPSHRRKAAIWTWKHEKD